MIIMADYLEMKKRRRLAIALFAVLLFMGAVCVLQNHVIQVQRKLVFQLWDAYQSVAHGCGDSNFVQ